MRGDEGVWPDWPDRRAAAPADVVGQDAVPSDPELLRMVEAGWSHERIRLEIESRTGRSCSRAMVSAVLVRVGALRTGHQYFEYVPWRVQLGHSSEYAVRMLRLLGRRGVGIPLDEASEARLDAFLDLLDREASVVGYLPTAERGEGFRLLRESWRAGPNPQIPIRVRTLSYWDEEDTRPVPVPDGEDAAPSFGLHVAYGWRPTPLA